VRVGRRRIDVLNCLFNPKSVAIVGASSDRFKLGGQSLHYSKFLHFQGRLYPVNPNAREVQGVAAYPSVSAIPEAVECVVISIPAAEVIAVAEECARKGVKAMVVFASGFAEIDEQGRRNQERLAAIARAAGMRVLGPNCMGALCVATGFVATFNSVFEDFCARGWPKPGSVGIASQSGAVGSTLMTLLRERGVGLSRWVTTGNQCDIDVADCIDFFAGDPHTRTILAYLEGCIDGARLIRALERARAASKPVIMLKVGASAAGAVAVATHTASIAGSDRVYDAVFRQCGAYRAGTMAQALDVALACERGLFPVSNAVGLVSTSGGLAILMADAAEAAGLAIPPLPESEQRTLKRIVPEAGTANPLDVATPGNVDMSIYARFLEAALRAGGYPAVVAFLSEIGFSDLRFPLLLAHLRRLRAAFPERVIALVMPVREERRRELIDDGFLVFEDATQAIRTIGALAYIAASLAAPCTAANPAAGSSMPVVPQVALGELGAKALLGKVGLRIVDETLARSAAEAVAAVRRLGFPVVLKIASPRIAHKSEIGGVILGVASEADVIAGHDTLLARAREHAPGAAIDGVLVAPMIQGGIETIIGIARDPVFGPVIMVGIGGTMVEVYRDVSLRLCPVGRDAARAMIRELRGFEMLDGARGRPKADIGALAEALVAVSAFAHARRDQIESIDINPLIALPEGQGVVVVDALIMPRVR
jgi:acetate---CoA ligase (ADP-forming)